MSIDYVFILAAGKGTRMGRIGNVIPKPLWPVFEKSLLELQILYVRSLGVKKIFLNTHHLHHEIEQKIKELNISDITISHEPELLDIGGGVHKVAQSVGYSGKLLVLNCDQFLWLDTFDISNMNKKIGASTPVVLSSINVNPADGYNGIKIDADGNLIGLLMGDELIGKTSIRTYGGVSLIDLANIPPRAGKSKFFDSIANQSLYQVAVWDATDKEYWDFGTKFRFTMSHWEILAQYQQGSASKFVTFLLDHGALLPSKIKSSSYGSDFKETIQLNQLIISRDEKGSWEVFSPMVGLSAAKTRLA